MKEPENAGPERNGRYDSASAGAGLSVPESLVPEDPAAGDAPAADPPVSGRTSPDPGSDAVSGEKSAPPEDAPPRRTPVWKTCVKWALPFLPALAAVLLLWVCRSFPLYTELVHARIVYPVLASVLAFLNGIGSFSFTELLTLFSVPLLVLIVLLVRRYIRRAVDRKRAGGRVARGAVWCVCSVFLLYTVMHGVNFYRAPMSVLYGLDMSAKSPEFLQQTVAALAQICSGLREQLAEDENGVMRLENGREDCLLRADEALERSRTLHPLLRGNGAKPKWVMVSELWSYTGITGFYMMPLCEANVNTAQPDFGVPFTVAHELAHTCGFAREDEANFAAFLLCSASEDPEYAYSGYLMAYIYCANALFDYDLDMWEEARAYLSEDVRRDLADQRDYWNAHKGAVELFSTSVNDAFLKAQGQEDGVLSYDRVVALILGWVEKLNG